MADKDEKPKTVKMTALQVHSYHGIDYAVGDTYDADEGDVTTIQVQGKGCPSTEHKPAPKAKDKK